MSASKHYDTETCPRCGRKGLRYEGYLYESGDFPGGGDHFSCAGCDGWFSLVELRRLDKRASFND